jgi:hypothetical protein
MRAGCDVRMYLTLANIVLLIAETKHSVYVDTFTERTSSLLRPELVGRPALKQEREQIY